MTESERPPGLDSESAAALTDFLAASPAATTLAARREAWELMAAEALASRIADLPVTVHDLFAPAADGHHVRLRMYRPQVRRTRSPAVLLIHGGGMTMGSIETEDLLARQTCAALGVPVASVGYRLAPENPYPAGLDDCVTAFDFLCDRADDLDVDPEHLALFGGSAGGGLSLGLALRLRDGAARLPRLVVAAYPMIDDRCDTPSQQDLPPLGVWDRADNLEAWRHYLGQSPPDQYAAPSRATNLVGLPPVFLDVGDHDLFRDEVMAFAGRLARAGVVVEFHLYPGAYHASEEIAPDAELSQRIIQTRLAALRRWLSLT